MRLTDAQKLKFEVLATGLSITQNARTRLDTLRGERALSPADFASTSGLILRLEGDVWVNAPIYDYNPNFVSGERNVLDVDDADGLVVRSDELQSLARVWLPPDYHGKLGADGRPLNDFVFSHGDRARLSPMRGCAMRCKFCNVPYEDPYEIKPLASMLAALGTALTDALQPAHHVLISGGTPNSRDVPYLRSVYEAVLVEFEGVNIDIMMVPVDDLLDVRRLRDLGLHELSINIELVGEDAARALMPQKWRQGLDHYLRFIADAADVLGPGRVRSMVMVGLEPPEATLAGVEAIAKAGGLPVLSPFRPDPATPLRDRRPMTALDMAWVHERAVEIAGEHGTGLGPDCPPCSHNTLNFVARDGQTATYPYPEPALV